MKLNKSFLLKGSLILFASNIAMRGLDFAYRVLMGRMLVPYEYGLLNLAVPLQFMIIIVASAGVAPSVARYISKYKASGQTAKLNEVVSSAMFYYSLLGIGLSVLFILLAEPLAVSLFHTAELVPLLIMAALTIPIMMFVAIFTGTFQGFKKMEYMSYSLVVGQIFRLILAVAFVWLGWMAFGAVTGSLLGFLMAVPLVVYLYRKLKVKYTRAVFSTFKEILYFSIPTTITALSIFLLAFTDIFFIGAMLEPVQVGIYSAASPIARLPIAFAVAVSTTLLPMVSESHEKKDKKIRQHTRESTKMITIAVIPMVIGLFVFAGPIIGILFGPNYLAAVEPLRILSIGVAFMSFFAMSFGIFQGMGKPRIPMYVLLFVAVLNIILNSFLIPAYGINGAAIATSVSSAVAGMISLFLVNALVK